MGGQGNGPFAGAGGADRADGGGSDRVGDVDGVSGGGADVRRLRLGFDRVARDGSERAIDCASDI